jgi:hypothetical protein
MAAGSAAARRARTHALSAAAALARPWLQPAATLLLLLQAMPGLLPLCAFLDQQGIPRGLITRNVLSR